MVAAAVVGVLVAAALPLVAHAQPFEFDGSRMPGPLTLHSHYLFRVYSLKDAPTKTFGDPILQTDVQLLPDEAAGTGAATKAQIDSYQSLQIAVFPYRAFEKVIDAGSFCTPGTASQPAELYLRPGLPAGKFKAEYIRVTGEKTQTQKTLQDTEVYVLAIANCGNLTGFKVSGTVSVKNPHGYLQATEYGKMSLYGYLLIFYVASALLYLCKSVSRWGQLYTVQKNLLWIALMGTAECGLMWFFYNQLNTRNAFSQIVFLSASVTSLWKVCFLFRDALQAAELFPGPEYETTSMSDVKVHLVLVAYSGTVFNFLSMLRFRGGYDLGMDVVIQNAVPAILMGVVVFLWGYLALANQKQALRENKRDQEASVLKKSQVVTALAGIGALFVVAAQLKDPSISATAASKLWRHHYFFSDGAGQILFALTLAAAMCIWMPSESMQGYAYGAPADDVEGQPIGAAIEDMDDDGARGPEQARTHAEDAANNRPAE